MAGLTGRLIKGSYKDLLTVSGSTANEGLESSVKQIFDGEGIGSPLWLGTNSIEMSGTVTVTGTFNLQNKTSAPSNPNQGDLAMINGQLYVSLT